MNDKIHKSVTGNVMVTGKPRSDVPQPQQRHTRQGSEPLTDALRKNCNAWIILKPGDEHHGE